MPREYVIYYLVYGFVFIAMGLSALQHGNDEQISNLPLAGALPDLGAFGIIHGLTEWMTMLLATGLFPELMQGTIVMRSFLKALSFVFFLRFGMRMYWHQKELRSRRFLFPWVMLAAWTVGYVLVSRGQIGNGPEVLSFLNTWTMRYAMAIPAGILTFLAFQRDATLLKQKNKHKQAGRTQLLAISFLVYGLLDGLVVRGSSYFPASVLNHQAFYEFTGLPIQLVKAFMGALILWGLTRLIAAFTEETKLKIESLLQARAAEEERRRIGMTLHDGMIQKLYASGLKVEYLLQQDPEEQQQKMLQEAKEGINKSMEMIRELLNRSLPENIEPEELMNQLQQLVEEYRQMAGLEIRFMNRIPLLQMGKFSHAQSTHIYYIVQEALCNTMKHADATEAVITLSSALTEMVISVRDNGQGISRVPKESDGGKGLLLMKQRAEEAGGTLSIQSKTSGTLVTLRVPWEE